MMACMNQPPEDVNAPYQMICPTCGPDKILSCSTLLAFHRASKQAVHLAELELMSHVMHKQVLHFATRATLLVRLILLMLT